MTTQTLTVSIDSDTAAKLQASVEAGSYATVSAAAQAALATWYDPIQAKEELRRLWRDGLASGPGRPGEDVFRDLMARYNDSP